jgi:hypothetical protein
MFFVARVGATLSFLSMLAAMPLAPAETTWLLTNTEATALEQAALREANAPRNDTRALPLQVLAQDGPDVTVILPDQEKVKSPIDVVLRFRARKAAVDTSTMKLHVQKWVLRGFFGSVDLTSRVRDKIQPTGLEIRNEQIPRGKYRFELSIKDVEGAESSGTVIVDVE